MLWSVACHCASNDQLHWTDPLHRDSKSLSVLRTSECSCPESGSFMQWAIALQEEYMERCLQQYRARAERTSVYFCGMIGIMTLRTTFASGCSCALRFGGALALALIFGFAFGATPFERSVLPHAP